MGVTARVRRGSAAIVPRHSERLTQQQLAELLGIGEREIRNLHAKGLPRDARGYPAPACVQWYLSFKLEELESRRGDASDETKALRRRRLEAETRRAEVELAQLLEQLIPADVHEQVVGEIGERLRAVLINVPANFTLHLERVGLTADAAQAVLEEIAAALTLALRADAEKMAVDAAEH